MSRQRPAMDERAAHRGDPLPCRISRIGFGDQQLANRSVLRIDRSPQAQPTPLRVVLAEHDHMVQALTLQRSHHSHTVAVLPWRPDADDLRDKQIATGAEEVAQEVKQAVPRSTKNSLDEKGPSHGRVRCCSCNKLTTRLVSCRARRSRTDSSYSFSPAPIPHRILRCGIERKCPVMETELKLYI